MPDVYSDSEETPWELLARHLAGEASASEQHELYTWVTAAPARLALLTAATRAWERGGTIPEAFAEADVDPGWQRFRVAADLAPTLTLVPAAVPAQAALTPPAPPAAPMPAVPTGRVVPLWPVAQSWLRLAAAVLLLVGAWSLLRPWLPGRQPERVTIAAGTLRRQATLPDGSRVWLNHHSTLSYAAGFTDTARVVSLQGEAFFNVRKDHGRPFTVLANDTRTRVLGTSFNVRAYVAEDSVEVAVVTGRVLFGAAPRLTAAPDSVLLTPGLRGVIRRVRPAAAVRAPIVDPNFRAWQRDELVFDDQSLAQVAQTLSRYYNTPVTLAHPALGRCRFTGTFQGTDLPRALRVVSLSANLSVRQSAAGYVLDGQACQ